jgi:hypothetical protein
MQSEIDSLREVNSKLLVEITELRKENAEVKAENIEVKAENAKLKHALEEHEARFTNLEQRDKEKTTLIAKLDDDIREIKQEQNAVNILAQSNTSIPKSPMHSITSQSSILPSIEGISKQLDHSDHSIEKNNADPVPRELPISQDFDSIPFDQINIPSVADQYDTTESKSLEDDRETDSFLNEMHKKKVSDEIRQRRQKEKLQHESIAQDLIIASISEKDDRVISEISEEFKKTVPSGNDQSHMTSGEPDLLKTEQDDDVIQEESLDENQIIEQGLIHELCSPILPEEAPDGPDNVSSTEIISSCVSLENMILGFAQHLSYLFETAIKSSQQEILDWHNYSFEFESKVGALTADGRIKDKMARSMIYKEMKPFLPTKITQANLRKKTHKARKHLILFGKNGVGIDKIKLVSYSATEILKLTNAQIQNVINQVKKYTSKHQSHVTLKTIPLGNDQIKAKVSILANILSLPQSNPTYDCTYFRNKILDQYPNLYREGSSENFDYYGITDETSYRNYICPLCKLGHDDEEIEGRYKAGSYFIKCEQREIEIVA